MSENSAITEPAVAHQGSESFQLIEQNEHFVIINKMPGVSFHTEDDVLGIVERVKASLSLRELYPVHRLDKITSGLLILAKTVNANRELSRLFRERVVEKYYLAIVDRKPNKKQGLIKGDMTKSRRGMWKLTKTNENPAITQFFSTSIKPGKRLFLIRPKTGKTHQIRVALNSLGAPVLGDPLYNAESTQSASRGYLHAFAIKFEYETKAYCFVCEPSVGEQFLTETFKESLQQYAEPWLQPWPKV